MRLSLAPLAIADRVPVEHGHTTMDAGAPEPEATGAVHCSRPHTTSRPLSVPAKSRSAASALPVPAGRARSVSMPITTRAALDRITSTSQSAASKQRSRRSP